MKTELEPLKYYQTTDDPMWQLECEKLMPWLYGLGADIGSGRRSIWPGVLRVDCDLKANPDVLSQDEELNFKDNELDYIYSIHSFEHFESPHKALTEWLRVIKPGGYIGIVHPDINFTKKQKPNLDKDGKNNDPYNKHYHEHTQKSFLKYLRKQNDLPFIICDYGEACPNWSFYVILRKITRGGE